MNRHIPQRRLRSVCQHGLSLVTGMTLIFVAFYLGAATMDSAYRSIQAEPVIFKSDKAGHMIDV